MNKLAWPQEIVNQTICGDCLEVTQAIPDESIDMCMTSPPYWGLRDYGIRHIFGGRPDCNHRWGEQIIQRKRGAAVGANAMIDHEPRSGVAINMGKHCEICGAWEGQIGLEPTPELYIEHMTAVFHEVKRVLKKEGTLWLNMGDTYSTHTSKRSGQFGKDIKDGFDDIYSRKRILPLQEKCLCMIPERLAWSLIQDGWILRNKIIWYKPNAMPSSVKDRFSNKWEYLYLFSKSKKYYFDLDAVREPHKDESLTRESYGWNQSPMKGRYTVPWENREGTDDQQFSHPLGKNPGDVFIIPTQPFPEAHFAVFPEKLCEKPIKAGCPEEVCKKCGKAKTRITEQERINTRPGLKTGYAKSGKTDDPNKSLHNSDLSKYRQEITYKTIGWASCDCNAGFKGGVVLDPFCGAGTTCYVAKEMGREYIGIDIKDEYINLNDRRLAQGVL